MRTAVAPFPRRVHGNPYCDLLYGALERLGVPVVAEPELSPGWLWRSRAEVSVLHLHWPELCYRNPDASVSVRSLGAFVASLLLAVALGYRIVWTVHNARPHEARPIDRLLYALLLRVAHPVVHCVAARRELGRASAAATVIPHGSYTGWYPDRVSRDEARARLGLEPEDRVLLWFGQVRPYKSLAPLVRAVHGLAEPRVKLVVAGRPVDAAAGDALRAEVERGGDDRVRLHLRHVADDEVQCFFRACDLVVLPYKRVLTSGAAVLALSFGRALVVPRLGCLAELESAGCAIGYDPREEGALGEALARALACDADAMGERARRVAGGLRWERIATAYARVYATGLLAQGDLEPAAAS